MATYLDRIVEWHRSAARADERDLASLADRARASVERSTGRDFEAALVAGRDASRAAGGHPIALVAEIKRRSPSKGVLAPALDPGEVARAYESGGASCLSVLTDAEHFGGSAADLEAARGATSLPVLRKDFTVCEADVLDARLMGADAVLLIVAALSPEELGSFRQLATELEMAALVEVHDEAELEAALEAGASLIGVNQRDLHTFEVDRRRAVRVAAAIPAGLTKVAESGVESEGDVRLLAEAGFDAVLVGETLVRSGDPRAAAAGLLGHTVPCG